MFLWHRQRSCMICSLNSMTPTRTSMNQSCHTSTRQDKGTSDTHPMNTRQFLHLLVYTTSIRLHGRLRGRSTVQKQE